MEPGKRNSISSPDQQALFDAISNCCNVNAKGHISLENLLQFIREEIEVQFVDSQSFISCLTRSLQRGSRRGWIAFEDVCKIFCSWMEQQSSVLQFKFIRPCRKYFPSSPLAPSTLHTLKEESLNDSYDSAIKETFYTACDLSGRDGSSCEVRSSIKSSSSEDTMTKYYEQKLEVVQKLLSQSEECNSALQCEIEALRRTCNILKRQESRWCEREMQLKEREQQMTAITHLLDEQKKAADAEIKRLRQQLSHLKSEHEILLSENMQLEENNRKLTKKIKTLSETKLKLILSEISHEAKDILLEEKEEMICQLRLQIEDLHETISSMEMLRYARMEVRDYPTNNLKDLHEESPETTPICGNDLNVCPTVPSDTISLKAELEACINVNLTSCVNASTQTLVTYENISTPPKNLCAFNVQTQTSYSLRFKNMSTQTSHIILATSYSQTDELEFSKTQKNAQYRREICTMFPCIEPRNEKPRNANSFSNNTVGESQFLNEGIPRQLTKMLDTISPMFSSLDRCERKVLGQQKNITFSNQKSESLNVPSTKDASTQMSLNEIIVPVFSSIDTQTENLPLYCSTYEMQLFVMEDASTQIDFSMRKGIVEMIECSTQTEEISTSNCEDSQSESCGALHLFSPAFVFHGAALQLGDVSRKEDHTATDASPRGRCERDATADCMELEIRETQSAKESRTADSTKQTPFSNERRSREARLSEVMAALKMRSQTNSPQLSRLPHKQDSLNQSSNTWQLTDSEPCSSQSEK